MGNHVSVATALYVTRCPAHGCGVTFAITQEFEECRREDHKNFYCPNGHSQSFLQQTEAEKLRLERGRLKQQMAQKDDEIAEARKQAEASAKRLARTMKTGTCPCCRRNFVALRRHMAAKHPDFDAAKVVPFKAEAVA